MENRAEERNDESRKSDGKTVRSTGLDLQEVDAGDSVKVLHERRPIAGEPTGTYQAREIIKHLIPLYSLLHSTIGPGSTPDTK